MNIDYKNLDLNLANFVLQSAFPSNRIIADDKGVPSVMVKIPKLTLKDLGISNSDEPHPAFIVNGKVVDAIYLSKYPNTIVDGVAASLPGVEPASNHNYNESTAACTEKGRGWHMMTRAEYSLLALICAQQGFQPRGNNCFGRDYHEKMSTAIPSDPKGIHTDTGTGPASWYHNNSYGGIADLNGNTNDWTAALRLVYGELQVIPNNDAADGANSQAGDSDKWMAIDGTTGEYIKPQGDGKTPNSIKLDFYGRDTNRTDPTLFHGWLWTTEEITDQINKRRGVSFVSTVCQRVNGEELLCEKAREKLRALCLLPPYDNDPDLYGHCRFFANNGSPDARCFCGGRNLDKENSGVFFFRIGDVVDYKTVGIGFRCAYVEL